MLVASSAHELPFHRHGTKTEKIAAAESQDPLIQATARYLTQQFADLNQITQEQQLSFTNQTGQREFVQVSPFKDAQGLNWLVVVTIPESDFMAQINQNNQNTLLLCGIALVASILIGILISRWMTRPILQLKQAAIALAQGDFDQHIQVDRKDELGILASAFNSMVAQLQDAFAALKQTNEALEQRVEERTADLEAANQKILSLNECLQEENVRMSAELDVARTLQQMILPKEQELRQIPGLDVAGFMQAANEVGGDYYDVLKSNNGLVRIGIGDVTGHGLESGVLMIMVQTAVRTLLVANEHDPVKVLNTLNQVIYDNAKRMNSDKNLTLMLLDYADGHVLVSGQHEEMIVVRSNSEVERIDTIDLGFPIGLVDDITAFVTQRQIDLQSGDVAVLYTDGITEAEGAARQLYGLDRLVDVIKNNCQYSAEAIRQAIVQDVHSHIGDRIVYDDITLVVLKQK
jgi:sigma-B regulation protein RsbU (phosphoserine phosphatase)